MFCHCRGAFLVTVVGLLMAAQAEPAWAIAWTEQVAVPGTAVTKQVADEHGWPAGVLELINDSCRTTGWQPIFSELPNDVEYYLLDVKSADDVARIVEKFSAIKASQLRVILSLGDEVRTVPYVLKFARGQGAGGVLVLGSQKVLDAWHLRAPDNPLEIRLLEQRPVASPPTLKLYVGCAAVDLSKLKLPASIEVLWNYEPSPEDVADGKQKGTDGTTLPEHVLPRLDAVRQFVADHQAKRQLASSEAPRDEADSKWRNCAMRTWKKYVESKRRESEFIPFSCWDDEIRRLDPLYVYHHHVNIVVVLKRMGRTEEGLYIANPLSSSTGDDGYKLEPTGEKGCSRFRHHVTGSAGESP